MAETIVFETLVENCKLTDNQKVALAGLINSHWMPEKEGEEPTGPVEYAKITDDGTGPTYAVYATTRAKERCALAPRALGAVFSGLGKRVNAIDEILYCKDYLKDEKSKKKTGNNAILILGTLEEQAIKWASQFPTDPYVEPEEVTAEKARKKAEKDAEKAAKKAAKSESTDADVKPAKPLATKPLTVDETEEEEEEVEGNYLNPTDYLNSLYK